MITGEPFAIARTSAVALGIREAFVAVASQAKANSVGLGGG
jgi:hypothetical protein